jgi:hypothetical protein
MAANATGREHLNLGAVFAFFEFNSNGMKFENAHARKALFEVFKGKRSILILQL